MTFQMRTSGQAGISRARLMPCPGSMFFLPSMRIFSWVTVGLGTMRRRGGWSAVLMAVLMEPAGFVQAAELEPRDSPAPVLVAESLTGEPRRLDEYRGRVVLLNFWATWCPPCVREMPSLQRLQRRMAGRPFAVVAVNSMESREDVEAFMARMNLNLMVWLDPKGDNTRRWKIRSLPVSFLIDAGGQIRYQLRGAEEWDSDAMIARIETVLPMADPDARVLPSPGH